MITHADNQDRRYKECFCSVCKTSGICIPAHDYYGSNGEPLVCEPCFMQQHFGRKDVPVVYDGFNPNN